MKWDLIKQKHYPHSSIKKAKDDSYILNLLGHKLKRPIEISGLDCHVNKTEKCEIEVNYSNREL